jgi:hypothetical protein
MLSAERATRQVTKWQMVVSVLRILTYTNIFVGYSVLISGKLGTFCIVAGPGNRDYGRRGSAALTMRHLSIRKSWY